MVKMKTKKSFIQFLAVPLSIGIILAGTLFLAVATFGLLGLLTLLSKITFQIVGGFLLATIGIAIIMGFKINDYLLKVLVFVGFTLLLLPIVLSELQIPIFSLVMG